jgi:hypothetical protein
MYNLIIDADPIVYRSGFSAETHGYLLVYETYDGEVHEAEFMPFEDKNGNWVTAGAAMKKWLDKNKEEINVLAKEKIVKPEPVGHALHLVNQEIGGIVGSVRERTKLGEDDLDIRIFLSGPDNFREKIATLAPYKGNRDADAKPHWYQQIRDHLTGRWNARVVTGREADDEVSITGWKHYRDGYRHNYVIATIDKDLDQVPGLHYDYRQKVFYNVSRTEAEQMLWRQIIQGDPTDNIPG